MEETVISIVQKYRTKIKDDAIFFAPEIPAKKFKNALDTYAQDAVFEEILVLIDNTLFGSAKDGALITDRRIYMHDLWSTPKNYFWKDIEKLNLDPEDEKKILINDLEFLNFIYSEKTIIKLFVEMLNEILAITNPEYFTKSQEPSKGIDISPIEALRELKKLYDEGILTEQEFHSKKQKYLDLL